MNEMVIKVGQQVGVISANFDELEKTLAEKMAEYEKAVFTEDSKKIAKGELSSLRALKKSIDDRRKEVKKIHMAPYDDFETQVKKLIVLVDKPINLIDVQIKEFDENRIKVKRAEILAIYKELAAGIEEYVSLEKIYSSKWDNVATTLKSIREEIAACIYETKGGIESISMMQSDAVPDALNMYKRNRNLAECITYINNFERQKSDILKKEEERRQTEEERRKNVEIESVRRDERRRVDEENKIREQTVREVKQKIASVDEKKAEPLSSSESKKVIYTVVATPDEIEQVEMAFNSLGIYFERKEL